MQSPGSRVPAAGAGSDAGPKRPFVVPAAGSGGRRRGGWRWLAAVVCLLTGLAWYWSARAASRHAAKGAGVAATVPIAVAVRGDVDVTMRVTGTIAAMNSAVLLAPRILGSRSGLNRGGDTGSGGGGDFNLVLLSLAKPGTHVKTGDVVAQFDPQNQLQRLDDYKDAVVQLEKNIQGMMASLAAAMEAQDQAVRSAKADWDKSLEDLKEAPVLSEIDAEKNKLSAEQAEKAYRTLAAETPLLAESQRAQIRIAELNRDQSRIELQRAESNVQKMSIKAPMDGIVVMASVVRNGEFGQIREGDQVNAGQPFMSIVDPRSMVLNATVNQVDAERLGLGMKAAIRTDAYPDLELTGSLAGIGAMAKESTFRASYVGEIPVRVKIDRLDTRLIPDLTGSAEIELATERNALVVPRPAVFGEGGRAFVYLETAEGWVRREVQLGPESYTVAAVRDGLQAGDKIALQRPI